MAAEAMPKLIKEAERLFLHDEALVIAAFQVRHRHRYNSIVPPASFQRMEGPQIAHKQTMTRIPIS